jgi:hypothetical protein
MELITEIIQISNKFVKLAGLGRGFGGNASLWLGPLCACLPPSE